MVYVIGYDLNKSGQNYDELYEGIKAYGTWAHYLDSTWFIETSETSSQIFNKLKSYIDDNDDLFIARIYKGYAGQLPQKAIDWLKKRSY